jgi:hypothetical protein
MNDKKKPAQWPWMIMMGLTAACGGARNLHTEVDTIEGTVLASGPVAGACVQVFEMEAGRQGALVGEAQTSEDVWCSPS